MPELVEKRKKRKTDDCEVIALDALEELDSLTFDLVGADAGKRLVADTGKMTADEAGVELAHRQPRNADMAPQHLAVSDEHDGAVELVRLAREGKKTTARLFHVLRLVQHLVAQRERLVGADDNLARLALRDIER